MSDCQNCDCQSNDSGFVFGLIIGAVIGATVAVLIYKNNKTEVFTDLRKKLENYFKDFMTTEESPEPVKRTVRKIVKPEKLPVILPKEIIKETASKKVIAAKPRKFVKPKK
jgi:hypothetical protein